MPLKIRTRCERHWRTENFPQCFTCLCFGNCFFHHLFYMTIAPNCYLLPLLTKFMLHKQWLVIYTNNSSSRTTLDELSLKLVKLPLVCPACCVCGVCAQSCPTLCNPVYYSWPGSLVHRTFQEELWSRLPFSTSGDLLNPRIKLTSPALADRFFNTEPPGKPTLLANPP